MSNASGNMKDDKKISIIVVVNTEDVPMQVKLSDLLGDVAENAHQKSESKKRAFEDFEFKDSNGELDRSKTVEQAGIVEGAKLFLSLRVGVTG